MGPTILQRSIVLDLFCLTDRNCFVFETFGKKKFKLICHTSMYEAIKDIIEETDDEAMLDLAA